MALLALLGLVLCLETQASRDDGPGWSCWWTRRILVVMGLFFGYVRLGLLVSTSG